MVKGFTSVIFSLLLILFITFFYFLEGDDFINAIRDLSPLDPAHNEEILGDVENTIKATLRGTVIVALIQGILGGTRLYHLWGSQGRLLGHADGPGLGHPGGGGCPYLGPGGALSLFPGPHLVTPWD